MELHIIIDGTRDLGGQLYRQLSEAIRSGRLADGQQLPPTRLLASQLGLSRKTVSDVYDKLGYEQLLVGKVGVGSFVQTPHARPQRRHASTQLASAGRIARWEATPVPLRHSAQEAPARYAFIGGRTTPSHFPQDEWRACVQHAVRQDVQARGRYGPVEGLPALRTAIAGHAAFSRGIHCTPEQILVCSGAQQALSLLAQTLLEAGDTVVVEEPGYPVARQVFAAQGARVVGVAVDEDGIIVEQIPDGTRLIYVTPAHQFPLGMPMSMARRHALLERARYLGAIIIEDDYDSAFRYEGRPTDSLQSMDRYGLVAHVGSFSKIMLPELRLGYVVLPLAIVQAVQTAKYLNDSHTASLGQHALAKFIQDGHLLRHIRRCHDIYAGRRERLQHWFDGALSPWFRLVPASAGFHVAALAQAPLDIAELLRRARLADISLYALSGFYHGPARHEGLFLGYGAIDKLDIDTALAIVHTILQEMAPLR
ncbi:MULTISPECIES: PLP-dependent aminotransferase family protein [unclassified Janthinobacterium]|uniref:MocR-like pyridoxine biosynthesis transcription factor PdxR n=1 Tax=unclassified Janthinobacterium TaxID=2610881 RepID=UPI0016210831|nr:MULTISPECIES: PLP-dependent aminotransferase family protein [unclassified Janthinobacterium]MBB5609244.1 GntR family transcriptional regulator/MocR family aminotransferase [Janthinobacterium sp. S3T4]MBB5614417.1 GntR family transcriptional regulator/MocR family aminotransferase [Janthinobacterium sp. S3M3]